MPPTEVNCTAEASWLTNALTAIENPTQLDRQATIKSCVDLVSWLRADTCYQNAGANIGWRDRVSGALFEQASGTYPTAQTISNLNSEPALVYASGGAVLTDNGANLFPNGNVNFSIVFVGEAQSGGFQGFVSDGGTSSTGTILLQSSGNVPSFYMGGSNRLTGMPTLTNGQPWLGIISFQYGAGSTGDIKARVNGGVYTCEASGLNVAPVNDTLTIAGYSGGVPLSGCTIAEVMIFKGAILHGNYLTNTYLNWSNEALYQVIEDYMNARYAL
ncbi:MAG TPA: hypothetical protein VII49_01685 [Rhizomicrobium sp.]